MNPYLFEMYAKQRHQDLLEEAERMRLLASINKNQPSLSQTIFLALADRLIALGNRLQQRYSPQLCEEKLCKDQVQI